LTTQTKADWALVLGASSGFGRATALELARAGLNVAGMHLDTRATLPNANAVVREIESLGRKAVFFNGNAADPQKREAVLNAVAPLVAESETKVRVLLHSLAFGSLRPYIGSPEDQVAPKQMDMTLDVMANSLVYWVQDAVHRGLLRQGSRVFAMTSAGSSRVWPTYGPVSAAKAALESHVRQLAYELAPKGVTVNAIRAGVTDTPALRKIPGHDEMIEGARRHNPSGRLTTPEDVARAIALLCDERASWITGNVIGVDGGEDIAL
jgi:NAD(P)-dependent dehydrogenase (short-subunit alcohol dehydrogenase family)